ncbi:hypothetical protein [Gloeobacter violaceus]|nr:hypothetical protein [Gloeobacter violaceus]
MHCWSCVAVLLLLTAIGAAAQTPLAPPGSKPLPNSELERESPVFRRWIANPPDLLYDIENGQAFPTRLGIGIAFTPSRSGEIAYSATLQDIVLGGTRLSLSGDFWRSGTSNQQWGANARYYILPLGSYFNIAPQFGYRNLVIDGITRNGLEAGAKFLFALSPRAADIAFIPSWVTPDEGGAITRLLLEFGYSLNPRLRLTTTVQWVNSSIRTDTSFGVNLELIGF